MSRPPEIDPVAAGPNVARGVAAREIVSPAPERAARFYAAVLGGTATPGVDAETCVVDLGSEVGRWTVVRGEVPVTAALRIEVVDLDAALVELAARRIPFDLETAADGTLRVRTTDPDGRSVELRRR